MTTEPIPHPIVDPMGPEEARQVLARVGWTQRAAARYLGIAHRTMKRYVSNEMSATHEPIPATVAILLRLYNRYPILAHDRALGIVRDPAEEREGPDD